MSQNSSGAETERISVVDRKQQVESQNTFPITSYPSGPHVSAYTDMFSCLHHVLCSGESAKHLIPILLEGCKPQVT